MPVITKQFSLDMQGDSQVKNITEQISNILSESEVNKGIVTIFIS